MSPTIPHKSVVNYMCAWYLWCNDSWLFYVSLLFLSKLTKRVSIKFVPILMVLSSYESLKVCDNQLLHKYLIYPIWVTILLNTFDLNLWSSTQLNLNKNEIYNQYLQYFYSIFKIILCKFGWSLYLSNLLQI